MLSIELKPKFEPPNPDGIIPLLMHGTPNTGSGSSGGVTCKLNFTSNEYSGVLAQFIYLQANAAIQRDFDWIRMVAGLHQCGEMTDANFFERRFSSSRYADIRQSLPQRIRSSEQYIVVNLNWRKKGKIANICDRLEKIVLLNP